MQHCKISKQPKYNTTYFRGEGSELGRLKDLKWVDSDKLKGIHHESYPCEHCNEKTCLKHKGIFLLHFWSLEVPLSYKDPFVLNLKGDHSHSKVYTKNE